MASEVKYKKKVVVIRVPSSLSCGIGFLSVGFPSKKCSEQTNTCLGRDFLFKAFAHCNRIDSLEGIVCSLYGIIQEQSSCLYKYSDFLGKSDQTRETMD
jgi:hypothetical protein